MKPADLYNWTDTNGARQTKEMITLPSKNWAWVSDWLVDRDCNSKLTRSENGDSTDRKETCDAEGW
jgi:hypothetical protein